MVAEILSVGTELLLGQIVNSDTQFLSRRLAALGISVYHTQVVGDNENRIEEALRLAMSRSDIVIMTGGLGPTDDDITKTVVARIAGVRLAHCSLAENRIRDYMQRTGREVNEANLRQAMLPDGCKVLLNDFGTAPGCVVEFENKTIIMLPGPPRELEPMFINQVEPVLFAKSNGVIASKYVRVFGVSEAYLQEQLADVMKNTSPTVSPYAKNGEVELRITANAETKEKAEAICLPVIEEIKSRIGYRVYTDEYESLQQTVINKLSQNGQTVATAESCTGGLLSKRITEISGSSKVFSLGMCTYSEEEKVKRLGVNRETIERYGVVSRQVAAEMAEGIRKLSGATVGIGITGVAGPETDGRGTPVGTVFVALSDSISVYVRELHIGRGNNERELVRTVASSHALDMLRLFTESEYEYIGKHFPIPQIKDVAALTIGKTAEPKAAEGKNKKPSLWNRFIHFFTDFPKDTLMEKLRKFIMVASIVALIVCVPMIASQVKDWIVSDRSINKQLQKEEEALNLTPEEEQEIRDELLSIGLEDANEVQKWTLKLLLENKDLIGRIHITNNSGEELLRYFVTQSEDNEYYVKHDFYGSYNTLGNIFLDYRCGVKDLSKNTVIYGHSTRDVNKMFNKLHVYDESAKSVKENHIINFDTRYKDYQWKVFAVMILNTDPEKGETFDYLRPSFESDKDFLDYVEDCRNRSIWDIGVDVNASDKIMTLSTCEFAISDARFVVMARQVRENEDTSTPPSVKENEDCIYYKEWALKYGFPNYIDTSRPNNPVTSQPSTPVGDGVIKITENTFTPLATAVYCDEGSEIVFTMPSINSYNTEDVISINEEPKNGRLKIVSSNKKVTYRPKAGFKGVDTFSIWLSETSLVGSRQTATVTVYVGVPMESGVTLSKTTDSVACEPGQTVSIKIPAKVNDGGDLYYAISKYECLDAGTAVIENGTVKYTQTTAEKRKDTIKVIVTDKNGIGSIFTITVNSDSQRPTQSETVEVNRPTVSNVSSQPQSNISSEPTVSVESTVPEESTVTSMEPEPESEIESEPEPEPESTE